MIRMFTLLALCCSTAVNAQEIDLTRYVGTVDQSNPLNVSFSAVPGSGRLLIGDGADAVTLELNGTDIALTENAPTPVSLQATNTLRATSQQTVRIRIKQVADIELHVLSRVHFNTNVSDFEAARAFYGTLGFETLSGFPDANTVAMAEAIGVTAPTEYDGSQGGEAGGYLLHGELIGVGGFSGGVIDLIEFTIPRNDEPPYDAVNHLGMARAVMHSVDLQADYARLSAAGVKFVSSPARRSDGTLFALFTDLDGTFYELAEIPGERDADSDSQIVGLGHLNINVSDFERSAAWYQMLGYEITRSLPAEESGAAAAAMGFSAPYRINGAILTHVEDGSTIELVEWLSPRDTRPPYPIPVNHLGIHRTAFSTTDIEADVAALKAQGVKFVSEITPCCDGPDSWGSIVSFYDPDGTIVELVEQPIMNAVFRVMRFFSNLFD